VSCRGWTLIEIALVLVVVGIILGIVASTSGKNLIGASHAQAVQATVKDLSEAIVRFRERYGYLPGDMPNATTRIPGVAAGSCSASANGNGDGQIDAGDEVNCVPNHLFNAGFIKAGAGAITLSQSDRLITIRAIARSASGVTSFPTSTRNVIEVLNLSCRSAQELDAKSDDGNFASGKTRASVASCVEGGTNDPVPSTALAL
jgi:prepilin-type N-terminal cleavage/methylation domain-containing protein